MLVIGLTGGIGCGKTTVSNMFRDLGICVVDTDIIARQVVEPGSPNLDKIREYFGNTIVLTDGSLDRKKMREIIFSQPEKKIWLENLLHPIIRRATHRAIENSTSIYTILSSPLLLESPDVDIVDRVAIVDVPEDIQLSRAASRDRVSESHTQKIVATQSSRKQKIEKADDVIDNSGSLEHTRQQVSALHKQYLDFAAGKN